MGGKRKMTIQEKMLKAYFHVAEDMVADPSMNRSAYLFHRTKKEAFFVEARRLDKDGYLTGEIKKSVKGEMK
jgi:hypothetical protein